jgi:hypothetical protein
MIKSMPQLLASEPAETILAALGTTLERSEEAPFWASKTLPLAEAVLSVLIPLRDRGVLFGPEGHPHGTLTPELFLRWCDLMCLKHLAFTLKKCNADGILHLKGVERPCEPIDTESLDKYLQGYSIDLHNEFADFPITHYNLHIGISGVLKSLM